MVCFTSITGNTLHKSDDDNDDYVNNNDIKMDLKKVGWGIWTGSIWLWIRTYWLRIGTCFGHL